MCSTAGGVALYGGSLNQEGRERDAGRALQWGRRKQSVSPGEFIYLLTILHLHHEELALVIKLGVRQ